MSERQHTVLVDMDNVLADFDTAAVAHLEPEEIVEREQFYVAKDYPPEIAASIVEAYAKEYFFSNLDELPGSMDGWQAMLDNGLLPRIASAVPEVSKTGAKDKISWLNKKMVPRFGSTVVSEAIFDRNKWKYDAIVILDDNPQIAKGPDGTNLASWEHILFGWPNKSEVPMAQTAFRLIDWSDPDRLITMIDEISQAKYRS
jgi:5'(3')-deoxyribonucleotidase